MKYIWLWLLLSMAVPCWGQADSAAADSLDLMADVATAPPLDLLPERMVFTQRIFWGRKGLLRITGLVPLTEHNREIELRIRRKALITHQILGYATLAAMITQGIVGSKLYYHPGDRNLRDLHETVGFVTNCLYFTTAGLSLLAPPPLISRRTKSLNSIKVHKALAMVHFTGMLATNLLAPDRGDATLRSIHRAAAYGSFGAFAAAMIVMKF